MKPFLEAASNIALVIFIGSAVVSTASGFYMAMPYLVGLTAGDLFFIGLVGLGISLTVGHIAHEMAKKS